MKAPILRIAVLATMLVAASNVAISDDDRSERAATASNEHYEKECGSCHFAYPPDLLPATSWVKIMSALDKHFGDDASLDAVTQESVTTYLTSHSADKSKSEFARKIMRSVREPAPIRITGLPYFIAKHDEVPRRLVDNNDQVRSFSNCTACHTRAQSGSFEEDEVRIAGHGKWD